LSKERKGIESIIGSKPVKVGDELDVVVTEVSRKGDGLTRVKGFVVFIPNTKPGDKVKIKITNVRPNYATAQVIP